MSRYFKVLIILLVLSGALPQIATFIGPVFATNNYINLVDENGDLIIPGNNIYGSGGTVRIGYNASNYISVDSNGDCTCTGDFTA